MRDDILIGCKLKVYNLDNDRLLRFVGRIYVPKNDDIKRLVMEKAHIAPYFAHLKVKKMLIDLKGLFFWIGMKKDITQFLA